MANQRHISTHLPSGMAFFRQAKDDRTHWQTCVEYTASCPSLVLALVLGFKIQYNAVPPPRLVCALRLPLRLRSMFLLRHAHSTRRSPSSS
jgi:hypothetical protein